MATDGTPYGPALVAWDPPESEAPPVLLCVYTGTDNHLWYSSTDEVRDWSWTMSFREHGVESSAGPALAAYGTTLYQFNKGNTDSTNMVGPDEPTT
jgi:hypothetical protein